MVYVCVGLVNVAVVSVPPSPKFHWNKVLALQELLNPATEVLRNVTGELTQLFIDTGLKLACGPVYTRIGEIEAVLLSHKFTALILNVNAFPA